MADPLRSLHLPAPGVEVVRATREHGMRVARYMRPEDARECLSACGLEPGAAVEASLDESKRAWAVLLGGKAVAVFGVADDGDQDGIRVGRPWLLAGKGVEEIKVALTRWAPAWVTELGRGYDILGNYVDARNDLHVRWLKRMGFKMVQLWPDFGVDGAPFFEFARAA